MSRITWLRKLFIVIGLLAGAFVSPAAASDSVNKLPQDKTWKIVLRDWLGSLEADAFRVDVDPWALEENYDKAGNEKLYRDWMILTHGRLPNTRALRADPQFFTLESIERGDGIYWFGGPAAMAWWVQLDVAGNPFRGSEGALRRALSSAIVDMLMLETCWEDPYRYKPDFMGANLGTWAYAYLHGRELMDRKVRDAFEQGMLYYLEHMERLAPRDGNTNMDMRELATLATLDEIFATPEMHKRLVNDARRILFGDAYRTPITSDPRRGCFHPGGYIGEADGPEASYNGISLFHLVEAAMITDGHDAWDAFMPEVIDRMLKFKIYNTFPEPDGSLDGPSSWAKRTNNPYSRDQRNRPWRDPASAMLSEHGLCLLGEVPTPEAMRRGLQQQVKRFNRNAPGGDAKPGIWKEGHWPADIPYTWDEYVDGSYARFRKLIEDDSPLLKYPYQRDEDFSIAFDREFWMLKQGDWGFQVEAVPHMGRGYDFGGSGALAGGSLATFWTRDAGCVILGRLPDKWNYVTWSDPTPESDEGKHPGWSVDEWTTNHLWGRTREGLGFSTARQRDPWVSFELDGRTPTVYVFGHLGGKRTVEEAGAINDVAHTYYKRRFEKLPDGLRVTSELLSRGEDAIGHHKSDRDYRDYVIELWESIPLYGGHVRPGRDHPDVTVAYRVGGEWASAGHELTADVEAVRVRRYEGAIVIEFAEPRRVELSEEIRTAYQSRDPLWNLRIDLLGSDGEPVIMPARAAVTYTIRPEK